jgi:hypothetical protein
VAGLLTKPQDLTEGLPFSREETFGRAEWRGQETTPQQSRRIIMVSQCSAEARMPDSS